MEFEINNKSNDEVELQSPLLRRSYRVRRLVERYSRPDFCSTFGLSTINDEPIFVKEAFSFEECKLWKKAMVEEMEALDENEA